MLIRGSGVLAGLLRGMIAGAVLCVAFQEPAHAVCRGGAPNGVREAGEQCDGSDTGPYVCQHFCMTAGIVRCALDCTIDTSSCQGCGNGRIDAGEVCDGSALGGQTCAEGGVLRCAPNCLGFDTRDCFHCGNGQIEGNEQCDGAALGGATCNQPGETGGMPTCSASCTLDRASCWRCGNGRVDPGEQCDDGNVAPGDGCGPTCTNECGNGTVQPGEECDDGDTTPGDGCHLCGLESYYDGGGNQLRECNLHWGVSGPPAPAAIVVCADGAACDLGSTTGQCTLLVYYCFKRVPLGGGSPSCTPTNVGRVELTGTSLSGPQALDAGAQASLLNAMAATLTRDGSTGTRTGTQVNVVPPLPSQRACGQVQLTVPKGQARALSVRVTDAVGSLDDDLMTLQCQ